MRAPNPAAGQRGVAGPAPELRFLAESQNPLLVFLRGNRNLLLK